MMRIVYLHGFASSPQSSKAQYFRERFAECGVVVEIPALDQGNFEALTITSQIEVVEQTVGNSPAILIGSSLGGYLAALYAARHLEIAKVVLMAPAFQFPSRLRERYSAEEFGKWEREGSAPVYHYGYKRDVRLGFQLMTDAARYEGEPNFQQPGLIFHGLKDTVVPADLSRVFAARHPCVELHLLQSTHELTDVLPEMWSRIRPFCLG